MLRIEPGYSDSAYWDNITTQYINENPSYFYVPDIESRIWGYFKYCLRSQNRYFFKNSLIPVIKASFEKNSDILKKDTEIFRARNDDQHSLWGENQRYSDIMSTPKYMERLRNAGCDSSKLDAIRDNFTNALNDPEIKKFKEKLNRGFQGYDVDSCGAPPSDKALAGRM